MSQQQAAAQPSAARPASAGDGYLDQISDASLEVLSYFGAEAPAQLNEYACHVEDALLEALDHQENQADVITQQQQYIERAQAVLSAAEAEREGMMAILSDPDELSNYTMEFFGPNGPVPTMTPGEQAEASLREGMVGPDGPLMPNPYQGEEQAGYQRPQMPMPTPGGGQPQGRRDVWGAFSQAMDLNPQMAWALLDQARPEELRTKVFAMEG